jgi:2-dehydro-3-deoxyphosphogluconate aldolase / (4S)-4-hydroxy-2-oxoglutarate aldolase
MTFSEQLAACRVLPVVTAHDVESTVALAEALAKGGMTGIEITLRTSAALASISAVKEAVPQLAVAVGTVTNVADMEKAVAVGADFCVSPGISVALLECSAACNIDFLPGVATATDILLGMAHGLDVFKLFPAVAVGGIDLLNSFYGPFPNIRFCPTGGLTRNNVADFLALPNVICCGGSWMVADTLLRNGDWHEIETLAREAMRIARQID